VPLVSKPSAFACRAERLARTGAGPYWPVVGPSEGAQSVAPDADPGEEVALSISSKLSWFDILDAPFVHVPRRNLPGGNHLPQPPRRELVVLVVVGGHGSWSRRELGKDNLIPTLQSASGFVVV
jgi:hypothetical protein